MTHEEWVMRMILKERNISLIEYLIELAKEKKDEISSVDRKTK